jgi:FkbM family methyltransferase
MKNISDLLAPYSFRGKARLLHALSPKEGERRVEMFGYSLQLDLSDYIQRSIYLNAFEPRESDLVRRYLKPGMTFVDSGANVGYYTLLAGSLVGEAGLVIAFEPSPYAFARLLNTVEDNHLPQVQVLQAGLSDVSGELQLYMPKLSGNHTPSMIANDGGTAINVTTHRLDEYLTNAGIDHVDLLKLDVEGFEPNVIRGAEGYIQSGRIHALLCEFNQPWLEANDSSPGQLFEQLQQCGYQLADGRFNAAAGLQNLLFIS